MAAGIDPEKLAEELSRRGQEWADKDAAFFALDETKKDVLALCCSQVNDQDLPQVKIEQKARTSVAWRENQAKLTAARREMNVAKVNYTVFQTYIELKRSKEATNRSEMQLI